MDLFFSRRRPARAAALVLTGLAAFWIAFLVAAAVNPAYSHRRDYVSVLAAHGAEHGWLGVLAIAAAGAAMLPAGIVLRRFSQTASLAIVLAGLGFLVVAFARLECRNGAAACGLGGRFAISGTTDVTHWTAATVATVLVIAAISLTGLALLRSRRTLGLLTLATAAVTAAAFLATGGETPGEEQRVGVVVATGWLAVVALATLVRAGPRDGTARGVPSRRTLS
jgi:hypothetical membrane protein